jgi:hypothetical protein
MTASMPQARRLRFAILCRGLAFPAWQAAALRTLLASGIAEAVLLIIDEREGPRPRGFRTLLYRAYQRLWALPRLKALRPEDLTAELGHLPQSRIGSLPEAARAMRSHRLDMILQLAPAAVSPEFLAASRFGIWTYDDPAAEDRHGMLSAFWAYRHGRSLLSRALLRLTAEGPRLLHGGSFRAGASWARSLDAALFGSADWCLRACRELLLEREQACSDPPVAAEATPRRFPGTGDVLAFLARRMGTLLAAAFRRCFLLEYWNIGIVDAPIERVVADGVPTALRWLGPPRPLHYYADPCALPEQPGAILVEEYSHAQKLGWISVIPLTGEDHSPRRIAPFDHGTHRSYPYLLSADGTIFCVPESAADRRVELYRALRFPDQWQHAATLIEDFPALDSTLFFHDGHWWLLCTSSDEGGEHKLHAWHAPALLGPWQPHPLNPLKCDVSSSRPAGRPFVMAGSLYRPAQDCSQTYGGAIVVNRIIALTPSDFRETPAGRIAPAAAGGYGAGLHTLCSFGSRTVIDGKRFAFDLRAAYLKARRPRRPAAAMAVATRAASPAGGLWQQ